MVIICRSGDNMKKFTLKQIVKVFLFLLGTAVLINGIVLLFTTNLNIGNLLTLMLGAVTLLFAVLPKDTLSKIPKLVKISVIAVVALAAGFSGFLLTYGINDTVNYTEDSIVVLGAGIHGESISRILRERLDTAVKYYNKNTGAIIVVSGGQGPQEEITEALAMERYLIDKGVPQSSIIKEEEASSTFENFKNSKRLLDAFFDKEYRTAFITNEYHIYRAEGIAKKCGFKNTAHLHSSTRWYSVLPGVLRECLAVIKYFALK